MTAPSPVDEVRGRAEQAAAAALGAARSVHMRTLHTRAAQLMTAMVAAVGITALFCGIPAALTSHQATATGLLVVIAILAIGLSVVVYATTRPSPGVCIVLFDHGLVYLHPGHPARLLPFTDIVDVRERIVEFRTASGRTGVRRNKHELTINPTGAATLTVDDQFEHIDQLARRIVDEVTRIRLPEAAQQITNGATVHFGPVAIDTRGLHHNHQSIQWSHIQDFGIEAGRVNIRKHGTWIAWANVLVSDIHNLRVFLTLADELHTRGRPP